MATKEKKLPPISRWLLPVLFLLAAFPAWANVPRLAESRVWLPCDFGPLSIRPDRDFSPETQGVFKSFNCELTLNQSIDPDGRCGKQWLANAQAYEGNVNSVGDFFAAVGYGVGGTLLSIPGAISSTFSQASQGMADARAEINTYSGGDAFLARSLMLPANFAFGTTALVNDPVDTVAGMPQGFVNLGGKIGSDVYNVGANPSVNSVFDIGEDALSVAGLSTGIARGLTATGVTAPLEDLSVQTYLQATKGAQWQSYYNSFAPGTAQLNVTLGGQTLFRAANSAGAAAFGEFASVEQPSTPAQAIQGNALDPAITGNTAGQLFQVTTRPGFSISGTAAAQGAGYPGGFSQVFQVGRNGIPTWSSVQQIPYSGVTP